MADSRNAASDDAGLGHGCAAQSGGQLARRQLIHITPHPPFSGFDGADQRVVAGMEVLGGMFVFGGVAAAHVAALQAKAEVDPGVSRLHAIFADVLVGGGDADLVEVSALRGHCVSLLAGQAATGISKALRSQRPRLAPAS